MTKMILVAALTNDRGKGGIVWVGEGGKVDRKGPGGGRD